MISFSEYKKIKREQDKIVSCLEGKLNEYPKEMSGMVIEHIRTSDEYRKIKSQFNIEFKKLQNINTFGMKFFKKEIRQETLKERFKKEKKDHE